MCVSISPVAMKHADRVGFEQVICSNTLKETLSHTRAQHDAVREANIEPERFRAKFVSNMHAASVVSRVQSRVVIFRIRISPSEPDVMHEVLS